VEGIIRVNVTFFCHDGNGRYLIQKRSQNARDEQGLWDCGGGGLKFGEKIEDAVRREVLEEYGTEVLEMGFIGFRDIFRVQNGTPTHWVDFDFKVCIDPLQTKIGEPHKCDAIRWMSRSELEQFSEPLHSQFPHFLEKYKQYFV
jgi:8-oxo-dGTP diphosphatase